MNWRKLRARTNDDVEEVGAARPSALVNDGDAGAHHCNCGEIRLAEISYPEAWLAGYRAGMGADIRPRTDQEGPR